MNTLPKARILVTRFPYESSLGGEELHTLTLMQELDRRGVASFFMGSCPVLLSEFEKRHFEVERANLGKPPVTPFCLLMFTLMSPLHFLQAGFLLRRARQRWGVNTVYMHSLGEKLLMTPWALRWHMKVVWVEHARIGRWFTANPWRWVYARLARRVRVVVTSNAMREILKPWAPDVLSIPCGVMTAKPEALPRELGAFMKSGFAVVVVARLTHDKGVDMLVHAVHSKPDVRLVIVGQGPLLSTLKKRAGDAPVRFVSGLPRGQLMDLFSRADVAVLPSRAMDPFGMVAAEAMSMGTAVLVTNVCGIASDLRHGEEAFIVEPTLKGIDKGLKQVRKDSVLRKRVAKQGQAFAKAHYGLEREVQAFLDVFGGKR